MSYEVNSHKHLASFLFKGSTAAILAEYFLLSIQSIFPPLERYLMAILLII